MSGEHRGTKVGFITGVRSDIARCARTIRSRIPRYGGSPREQAGMIVLTCAATSLGLGMVLQDSRWSATPAYGILLMILSAHVWGTIHLAVAALMACSIWRHRNWAIAFVAHVAAMTLIFGWLIAFVIRWRSDDKTTNANMTAWGVYLLIAIGSFVLLNQRKAQGKLK